jgi:hypothetical protein
MFYALVPTRNRKQLVAAKHSARLAFGTRSSCLKISLSLDQHFAIMYSSSRTSQQYNTSQQQQQGRTKKKEEDPDAFMRLVSLRRTAID